VYITGAAITHTRYTHGGSIKKKPTLLPRPRVVLMEDYSTRGSVYLGDGCKLSVCPSLGSLVVVYFRVDSRNLHETSVLLSLLLPRYFAATITFISRTEPSCGVVPIYCFWMPKIQVRTLVGANCQYALCGPSSPERLVRRHGECQSSHYFRFRYYLWVL
jgi:hypothetical protein